MTALFRATEVRPFQGASTRRRRWSSLCLGPVLFSGLAVWYGDPASQDGPSGPRNSAGPGGLGSLRAARTFSWAGVKGAEMVLEGRWDSSLAVSSGSGRRAARGYYSGWAGGGCSNPAVGDYDILKLVVG